MTLEDKQVKLSADNPDGKMGKLDVEFAIFCDRVRALIDDDLTEVMAEDYETSYIIEAAELFQKWQLETEDFDGS